MVDSTPCSSYKGWFFLPLGCVGCSGVLISSLARLSPHTKTQTKTGAVGPNESLIYHLIPPTQRQARSDLVDAFLRVLAMNEVVIDDCQSARTRICISYRHRDDTDGMEAWTSQLDRSINQSINNDLFFPHRWTAPNTP